jgi:hypothetical protein
LIRSAALGDDLAVRIGDDERVKAQTAMRLVVHEDEKRCGDRTPQAGLLAQLAEGGVRGLLAALDLASRKLPRSSRVLIVRTAGDEDRPFAHDDRQGDVDAGLRRVDQAGAPEAPGP